MPKHNEQQVALKADQQIRESKRDPSFAVHLLRDQLGPLLISSPTAQYWAGKQMARANPLSSLEAIQEFFERASFGTLTFAKMKKDEALVILSGSIVEYRLSEQKLASFHLEAGFLAQQFEHIHKVITEATEHNRKRKGEIHILLKWDRKDALAEE